MKGKIILLRFLEVLLGALFIYAGVQKLLHPYEFAEAVIAYKLLPMSLVGVVAATLPWIEILAGLSLASRLKYRSALLLLSGLVGSFIIIILITMIRGLKIDCGCGLFFQRQVGWGSLLEDSVLLIWADGLYLWETEIITAQEPRRANLAYRISL